MVEGGDKLVRTMPCGGCRARALLLGSTAALLLVSCQSTEEKVAARYEKWFGACGYPVGHGVSVPPDEEQALRSCVAALEQSYQIERAQNIQKGAAMLGYGSALMTTPPPSLPAHKTCDTRVLPGGRQATTTCY